MTNYPSNFFFLLITEGLLDLKINYFILKMLHWLFFTNIVSVLTLDLLKRV